MFKNFHWGHGIFLFYVVFVGAVLTALIASFGVDHSLVVDDYYAKDIAYQSQYDKATNGLQADVLDIDYTKAMSEVKLQFAEGKPVQGTVQFYRPSDKTQDFTQELGSNSHVISTKELQPGKWKVKVDWVQAGVAYYQEETIFI